MSRPGRLRGLAVHYAQGLLMGGADVIPGVSGGTMALIVGIYERLIASVRAAAGLAVALLRGDLAAARARWREVEWGLVVPLALGILSALLTGAHFIPDLLERYPVQSRALFFGLIAASLAIPWRRIRRPRGVHWAAAVAGFVLAFVLVGLPPREVADPPLLAVFGAAAIAICAMILPGVSGAFFLLVMGVYPATLRAISDFDVAYIATFAAGAAIGLGLFSRLLDHLLQHYHDLTMAALVGLMAGSLRALWPYQTADRALLPPPLDGSVLPALGFALLGFALVALLTRLGTAAEAREHAAAGPPAH